MPEHVLFVIFEAIVVVVEIFTIYVLLTGCLMPNSKPRWQRISAYVAYGLILGFFSIFYPSMALLPLVTVAGFLSVSLFFYKGHPLHHIFVALLYLLLVIVIEINSSTIIAKMFSAELATIHDPGVYRILSTILAKSMILAIVKVITIIMEKHKESHTHRLWRIITLLLSQIILIYIIAHNFIASYNAANALTYNTLLEIVGVFFVSIIIVWHYDLLVSAAELKFKNEIITINLETQLKYYNMVKANHETIRAIEHDRKKHMDVLKCLIETGNGNEALSYISSYTDSTTADTSMIFTDHPVVSAMLSNCIQRAKDINIAPKLEISIPQTLNVKDIDLTVIMGNTIDNALEALSMVPESEERLLTICLKQHDYYLFYEIINTFAPNNRHSKGSGKHRCGYGLKNVELCAKKYNGTFSTTAEENRFTATIIIESRLQQ